MELLPVLEPEDVPREGLWYALVPRGEGPGVSVGHTCTYISGRDGGKGKIVIVGGANPSGSFSDCHALDLDRHEWDVPEWTGLSPRYEHCTFEPASCKRSLWVFAGAQQSGNRNCVQVLKIEDSVSWRTVPVKGILPSPRTYHTSSACVGDELFVISGGETGATPPETRGTPPSPRHGHIIVAVGAKLYVHGGLEGEKFHSDMFCLDTTTMTWKRVRAKGDTPPGVAAHSALAVGKNIYVFGGMTADGASNTMYRFQTDSQRWTLVKFEGDLPASRLDHSMCLVPWHVRTEAGSGEAQAQAPEPQTVLLCFVFGGMDTQGEIHRDCVVTVLT